MTRTTCLGSKKTEYSTCCRRSTTVAKSLRKARLVSWFRFKMRALLLLRCLLLLRIGFREADRRLQLCVFLELLIGFRMVPVPVFTSTSTCILLEDVDLLVLVLLFLAAMVVARHQNGPAFSLFPGQSNHHLRLSGLIISSPSVGNRCFSFAARIENSKMCFTSFLRLF